MLDYGYYIMDRMGISRKRDAPAIRGLSILGEALLVGRFCWDSEFWRVNHHR